MFDRGFNTKDQAMACPTDRPPAWSSWEDADGAARRGALVFFLVAPRADVNYFQGDTSPQLTHALCREQVAPRRALARGIQLLGKAPRCPARDLSLVYALQQRRYIGHLRPGAHRSPHLMFRHRSTG